MPLDECYLPIHVGKKGKENLGYQGDDTEINISNKNPYYCELTGLYWGIKNLECDYIGLVHYRRHFSETNFIRNLNKSKFECILSSDSIEKILKSYDIILPKKRRYIIESLYKHYSHTHYIEHLDETRKIIGESNEKYLNAFDKVMKRTSAHMFNMFIMKKDIAEKYCEWLFPILEELERRIDTAQYSAFQARLYGRVSELLLDVWLEHNGLKYKEVPYVHMEKIDWVKKVKTFICSKFMERPLENSF